MILTVRELVNHLGMNPKTEFVGASILVRTLERLGAIKKVGTRPFLDDNGKPTIGRPSALYEFPETVTFDFPSEALEFVPKAKKAKKAKVSEWNKIAKEVEAFGEASFEERAKMLGVKLMKND